MVIKQTAIHKITQHKLIVQYPANFPPITQYSTISIRILHMNETSLTITYINVCT